MMFNFLRLRTNSYLKRNKTLRANLSYKKAHSVGIVFSAEDRKKHDEIKDFIKKLEHDGKRVTVISFLPKKKENFEFLFDFFTEKDLSFWGNITSPTATKFSETPFDLLYYIDTVSNPLVLSLMARSKAKCRVGKFWDGATPYFELMIENTGSTKALVDGMYKYTSTLR